MKRYVLVILALVTLLAGNAVAHKVTLFAYVESGVVYTESYFPDGRPVSGGTITVVDSQGRQLVAGVTDDKGLFQFPVPVADTLTIVLDASMGHKAKFTLKKSEVEAGQ